MAAYLHEHPHGCLLAIRVQPRSSRLQFDGTLGDRLKLRIQTAPVDGEANQAVVRFLAKSFGVPHTQVRILFGRTNRNKNVLLPMKREDAEAVLVKLGL